MEFMLTNDNEKAVNIKVIGIGDAGCSVVNRMVNDGVQNVEFIAINADKQALDVSKAGTVIQIGKEKFGGRGGVYNPESSQEAAAESRWEIIEALLRTDLLFIVAGMGGGTGTGAAPVVAEIARGMGILTIAMVTKPLGDEGGGRMACAEQGIAALQEEADSLIIIPCDRIQEVIGSKNSRAKVFEEADKLFKQGITDMLSPNINLDLREFCCICRSASLAHMGIGHASGKDKAEAAVNMALSSPLLDTSIVDAKAALVNITASPDLLCFYGVDVVCQRIQEVLDPDAVIFWDFVYDNTTTDEMQVTIIAAGFEDCECKTAEADPESAQDLKNDVEREPRRVPNIKVVGIGDAGGSVINQMISDGVQNVEFIAINTDKQALGVSKADTVIQIGEKACGGKGAGGDPNRGQKAVEEDRWEITEALLRTDLLFIVAGMGGGTGTAAAPVVAEIAQKMNILTIAMVTKPLSDEGSERMNYAEQGIAMLQKEADSLIVIPNDRIQETLKPKGGRAGVFEEADSFFKQGIISLSNMLSVNAFINLDFEDLCWVCRSAGLAYMGIGYASGKDKAETAVSMALSSPLLASIVDAKAALVNITASPDLPFSDENIVSRWIQEAVDPDAKIFWGLFYDDTMTDDEIQVTVIATHFEESECETAEAESEPAQGAELDLDDGWPDLLKIFE